MSRQKDEIEWLYAACETDTERASLEGLRERAGLTWECCDSDGHSHWTNDEHRKTCERCGAPRREAEK